MFIFLAQYKKIRRKRYSFLSGLLLCAAHSLLNTAIAEEECATDFYSASTCRSFDNQYFTKSTNLWPKDFQFSGNQIWYRKNSGGIWVLPPWHDHSNSENRAIHRMKCITDLFGVIVCDRNDLGVNELDTVVSD